MLDLLYQRQQKIKGIAQDVLIVGNPTMPSVPPHPGDKSQQLASLPGAEKEAMAMSGDKPLRVYAPLLNTKAIIGSMAMKASVV